jgi:hypothetical protein
MSFTLTGTITGAAITGLSSPTYTLSLDNNPANNGRQSYVSALGGTQSGVTTHSAADSFTVSVYRPVSYRLLNFVSSTIARKAPKNTWKVIIRKGVTYLSGQPKDVAMMSFLIEVPSGTETADVINFKAMTSLAIGYLDAKAQEVADSVLTNSI